MKFSEIWLREWTHLNPTVTNSELKNQLTMAGFQVSESKPVFHDFFCGIVIGKIVDFKVHPNLHKKRIIKVNNGSKKWINIICDNDSNYRKNLRVVVANIGAKLPNGKIVDPIFIAGEKSEGIFCTFSMLKLNDCKKKIIELPEDAPIGFDFYQYCTLNDNIIDVNIPYNRGDCLNIIGLSREIAAINKLKLKKIKINKIQLYNSKTVSVIIENDIQCPKFLGRTIRNIDVSVSTPVNIKARLNRCGICSTNVITDITNYVLLELGYPIHVFDYDKINCNKIYVRFSKKGEKLKLSSSTDLQLFENTLIISDSQNPLSIAGTIVGSSAMISSKTRNIFLHSTFFDSKSIIKQSQLYNLNTISSIRYERGIDINISELALNYLTMLLLKVCNGNAGPVINITNHSCLPKENLIILNRSKLDSVLGFHIKKSEITRILKSLGFKVTVQNTIWKVLVPTWRFNIVIEENLISEIIRIYGYDKIPKITMPSTSIKGCFKKNTISLSRIKTMLVDRGYQEVITYSFVNTNIQKLLYSQDTALNITNPINSNMSVMRLSLWPGLIQSVIHNQNRQENHICLFESGVCFIPKITDKSQISQKMMLAGIRSGLRFNEYWNSITSFVDFYDIKGDVEFLLSIINKDNNKIFFKKCVHSALHPNKSSAIYFNETFIGYLGMIHPMMNQKLGLKLDTFMFELSWDDISKLKIVKNISSISKFPKNCRDISIIVPNNISLENIINICKKENIPQLKFINVIDVYQGDNIPAGYKSITIKLTLQGIKHTLKEIEILKIINICIENLKKNCCAVLR